MIKILKGEEQEVAKLKSDSNTMRSSVPRDGLAAETSSVLAPDKRLALPSGLPAHRME